MYLIGLLFAASAYGFMTDLTHGCLAFGLGLMGAPILEHFTSHRRALARLKIQGEQAEE